MHACLPGREAGSTRRWNRRSQCRMALSGGLVYQEVASSERDLGGWRPRLVPEAGPIPDGEGESISCAWRAVVGHVHSEGHVCKAAQLRDTPVGPDSGRGPGAPEATGSSASPQRCRPEGIVTARLNALRVFGLFPAMGEGAPHLSAKSRYRLCL
jgi:hypothetical protein